MFLRLSALISESGKYLKRSELNYMNSKLQKISVMMLGIVLCVSTFVLPARADQPFMQAALNDLKSAYSYLKKATADKGGHRQNAMDYTNRAISAVNNGIAYDRQNPNNRRRRNDVELFDNNFKAAADQYNMQQAKSLLQSALNNLQKASADKGGYRQQALDLVRGAISETQSGIEYDRRN